MSLINLIPYALIIIGISAIKNGVHIIREKSYSYLTQPAIFLKMKRERVFREGIAAVASGISFTICGMVEVY